MNPPRPRVKQKPSPCLLKHEKIMHGNGDEGEHGEAVPNVKKDGSPMGVGVVHKMVAHEGVGQDAGVFEGEEGNAEKDEATGNDKPQRAVAAFAAKKPISCLITFLKFHLFFDLF